MVSIIPRWSSFLSGCGWQRIVQPGTTVTWKNISTGAHHTPRDGKTLLDFLPKPQKRAPPPRVRKPPWLKMTNPYATKKGAVRYKKVKRAINSLELSTVCQEAKCPNVGECWSSGTATIMIMGDTCTRGCRFCSVMTSKTPPPLDPDEPWKIAKAVRGWGLDYIVVTMVDRDDLPDQGAEHVAESVRQLRGIEGLLVEVLVGDFQGDVECIDQVVNSGMEVFAHNIETVRRLTPIVRDRRATYDQTLQVLETAKSIRPEVVTKSSIMLGFSEKDEEIHQTMLDLREVGVEVLTFGQYLQPTRRHLKVFRYVTPAEFDQWKVEGEKLGFQVASGPMVRSSYKAGELYKEGILSRAKKPAGMKSLLPTEIEFGAL